jgi:hypothetical protein
MTATEEEKAKYTPALTALRESPLCSLSEEPDALESYRFLWLRTFHPPVLVGLTITEDWHATAIYKETSGASGYEYGELSLDEKIDVSAQLLASFPDEMIAESILEVVSEKAADSFWPAPYRVEDGSLIVDGALWIVEGYKDGACHIVMRHSPDSGDPIHLFAWDLVELIEKRFYYDEVY